LNLIKTVISKLNKLIIFNLAKFFFKKRYAIHPPQYQGQTKSAGIASNMKTQKLAPYYIKECMKKKNGKRGRGTRNYIFNHSTI